MPGTRGTWLPFFSIFFIFLVFCAIPNVDEKPLLVYNEVQADKKLCLVNIFITGGNHE